MGRLYAGLDVGDQTTSICVVDTDGAVVEEISAASTPEAIVQVLRRHRRRLQHVGLETGSKASWLYRGLVKAKYPAVCLHAYHAHSVLKTQLNKTDANDAHGLALLLCRGIFREAHVKSDAAMRQQAVLTIRQGLIMKLRDLRTMIRMMEKYFGLEIICEYRSGTHADGESEAAFATALQSIELACAALDEERRKFDELVRELAEASPVCRRMMTIPGVGPITALTFVAAVDDPTRFRTSRDVGPFFGLTPRVFQSGSSSRTGGISHRGDKNTRKALFLAAQCLLARSKSKCRLRMWGLAIAKRKAFKIAAVACARKLAVLMHHMWIEGEDFDPTR